MTTYLVEYLLAGQWSRLHRRCETVREARSYAATVMLPPTQAHSRPPTRVIELRTSERIVPDIFATPTP